MKQLKKIETTVGIKEYYHPVTIMTQGYDSPISLLSLEIAFNLRLIATCLLDIKTLTYGECSKTSSKA